MGAKVFLKSYAWLRGSSADAIIFLEYHIVNAGSNVWRDVYLGMFADMDVGPINISSYWSHNYAAYDSLTRTGYVHNPRDAGSIPLGLSLLGASKPLDSLRLIWQWHEFDLPCGGFPDEDLYNCMSCEAFGNTNCIRQSQSPDSPRDTRFLFSLGPFDPVQPGDTVRMTFAFVSGLIIPDMLVNAERAHRIIESRGFIMPLATIEEQGGGEPITIRWTALERLPYGRVTSYRVYYGTNPSQYTDSLTTDSLSATFSGLTPGQVYYFAVSAIDEHGNISALSNEVSTAPTYPRGLRTINYQRSIGLQWDANHEFDIAGYNIYRRSSLDTTFSKLNTSLIAETTYVDTAVWGDRIYYYKITAIDIDGNESRFSFEVSGRLIPPAPPRNFVVGPGKTFVRLGWLQNADPDLAGYNIYRSTKLDSGFVKLNLSLWQGLTYIDSTIEQDSTYYYYVEAVDLTDAVTPSYVLLGKTVLMDQGILVVNQSLFPFRDSTAAFYGWLLREYTDTIRYPPPVSVYDFGQYSTVLWLQELPFAFGLPRAYPLALKGYLLGGGRLLVMGRRLPSLFPEFWYPFLSEFYGIDYLTEIDTTFNFVGAEGTQGFPSAMLDRQKLALTGGRLNYVERFPKRPPDQIIYTYRSDPFDPLAEGKAVGLRALDTMYKAYYLSFPLYYLDSLSAQALITDILTDFGEVTGVDDASQPLPQQYHLYQAYPNPFNPSTNVRFEVAGLGFVSLKVYDVLGREVATLVNEELRPGRYEATWNATQFASGVYYVRMAASGASGGSRFIDSKKILLMK
ncbi:MAG: fibronectin type III domain-containing protein [Ignavibacteriae bacterium]|nr:fibronectin type III domain-containing protein [Ignavibacteriota bacterium]